MKKLLCGLLALALFAAMPAMAQVYAPIPKLANGLTNTAVVLKPSAGVFQWGNCGNPNASVVYIQLYDTAGAVTVGTTTPVASFALKVSDSTNLTTPVQLFSGMQVAATTTPTGGTAPGSAVNCNFGIN